MSHEPQQLENVVKQLDEMKEKLQNPNLPASEANMLLLNMQVLMQKHSQLMELQSKKVKEVEALMQSHIDKMR